MAIVADLSGNFPASLPTGVDPELGTVNRTVASTPVGSLTPLFVGERVRDNVANLLYIAEGLTTADWALYTLTRRI